MKKIAIDFETYLISEDAPLPSPICMSVSTDGETAEIYTGEEILKYLKTLCGTDTEIIAHNLKFELGIIYTYYPELRNWVLYLLDNSKAWCTKVAEQIINLGRRTPVFKVGLADVAAYYLDVDISASKSSGDSWRLRYHELANVPVKDWPIEAVEYSKQDAILAFKVREKQKKTDFDSVRADFILGLVTHLGIEVFKDNVTELRAKVNEQLAPLQQWFIDSGFGLIDKKGEFKKNEKLFREYIENTYSNIEKTADGKTKISKDALQKFIDDPNVEKWVQWMNIEKMNSTFLPPLERAKSVIRSEFNPVVRTGRTSSSKSTLYPSVNLQQMPRTPGVRECFKARPGYKFVSIDYGSLELVSTAQQLYNVYGSSAMKDALNQGEEPVDLHAVTGAILKGLAEGKEVSYAEFMENKKEKAFKHYRSMAKPINLGYPGGIGPVKMCDLALKQYGVAMSLSQAKELKEIFFNTYPELGQFLTVDVDKLKTGESIEWEEKKAGQKIKHKAAEYAYRFKSILRRGTFFNGACNGFLMQTPSACGAKIMIYRVGKYCLGSKQAIRLLGFVHDELLLEIKDDRTLWDEVENIAFIMINSMKEIMTDIRVAVEASVSDYWVKEGGESKTYWRD